MRCGALDTCAGQRSWHLRPDRRFCPRPQRDRSIEADNAGNRYTGPYRLGGSVYFNNLTSSGDVASLRVLASNLGLLYGRASYQTLLGNASVGVAYARVNYELGREFKSLDARGSADIFSVFGSYPLIRSRNTNLYALGAVEARYLEDRIGVTSTMTNRDIRAVTAGFRGDQRDAIGPGGWSTFSVGATWGNLNIAPPGAGNLCRQFAPEWHVRQAAIQRRPSSAVSRADLALRRAQGPGRLQESGQFRTDGTWRGLRRARLS